MKIFKIAIILLVLPLLVSTTTHKFYVSTTNVEFVKEKQSVQIISKIFVEDMEQTLRARYNPDIHLDSKKETEADLVYLKKYVLQKLKFKINGEEVKLSYIGREYNIDILKMYFEIDAISEVKTIEIENKVLFDMFPEQQNIIHFKTSENRKSLVLDKDNPKGVLNVN